MKWVSYASAYLFAVSGVSVCIKYTMLLSYKLHGVEH